MEVAGGAKGSSGTKILSYFSKPATEIIFIMQIAINKR